MLFNQNENINPFAGYRANANDDEEAFEDNGLDGIADDDVADLAAQIGGAAGHGVNALRRRQAGNGNDEL